MKPPCPCKDCFRRKLLCHGSCQPYQEWKAKLAATAERREAEMDVIDYIVNSVIKRGKKK